MFPSLQQLCVATIVKNENIVSILNPPIDVSNFFDRAIAFDKDRRKNERMSFAEDRMFLMKILNGTPLVDINNEIRLLMETKPFPEEDKKILKSLPIFHQLPERIIKMFWNEAIVQMFFEDNRYVCRKSEI